MANYTTVRIDNETMEKLEEIAEYLEISLNIKISKASALRYVINQEYDQLLTTREHFKSIVEKEQNK
jgi:predicted transcriptional regulator